MAAASSKADATVLRAILFATPNCAADLPLPADFPAALLPLGHATLIERQVEQLAYGGVREIDVVACDRPEALRACLADGERLGVRIHLHLAKDPRRPYAALRVLAGGQARVIIGHTHYWLAPGCVDDLLTGDRKLLAIHGSDDLAWTGWASLPARALTTLCPDADADADALYAWLRNQPLATRVLDFGKAFYMDAAGLLRAQQSVMQSSEAAPWPAAWIAMPWGAMSPRAHVDPGARLQAPVLVGPGCVVARGASLGPDVVLSGNAMISAGSSIVGSVIMEGTYVGPGLEISQAIVQGGRVRQCALGVETVMPRTDGLLFGLHEPPSNSPCAASRVAATLAFALSLPWVALAMAMRQQGGTWLPWQQQVVVIGQDAQTQGLAQASLRCPGREQRRVRRLAGHCGALLDVAMGRRCWFGVRPRRSAEWCAICAEWQALLATAPVGVLHAPSWSADDTTRMEAAAAADASYVARRGWAENLRVLAQALASLGPRRRGDRGAGRFGGKQRGKATFV